MKFIHYDDPDPRLVYDNPNLYWGDPSYLLEKGDPGYIELQPGQPGYVPPDPRPARRRRRSLSPANPNAINTPNLMENHFPFNVVPMPGGGYTTRCVTQEDLLTAELVTSTKAALAAIGMTLTDDQIIAVGQESAKVRIAALAKGRVCRRLFGFFTDEPTCGGKHTDPDFSPTPANMNTGSRGRLAPAGQDLLESLLNFHRVGVLGDKVPIVTRVYNGSTHGTDTLTLGGAFRISGPAAFGEEPPVGSATLGVFVQRSGGTAVHVTSISHWTGSEIFGSWPAAISGTGNVTLSVVVKYAHNVQTSTFIYGTPLPVV